MWIPCIRITMSKWKIAMFHGLLLIFMSYFSLCAGYDYDYEDSKDAWGRCPWIRNRLKNGRVKVRSRGRIARFTCKSGYELVGSKFATCVRGQWNKPIPVCIAKGCPRIPAIANGVVTEKYRGAQLTFGCNPGYSLQGDASLFCDGSQWDKSAPTCEAASLQPQKYCDFEDPDLCGWSHDPTHDFDWRRHQFKTPSGHVGTGPSYDHTFGNGKAGYYMYEEASAPRNVNDSSRLFSPVYASNNSPGCFLFWYHMYGSTIGSLRIYIKPESHVFVELTPVWEKSGDQGNQWLRGNLTIPPLNENFQVVIEGIRGSSYLGDTAIDDVSLVNASCSALGSFNATEGEEASGDSCRGRCHEQDNSTSCGCTVACESDNTCCADYAKLCAEGNSEQPSGEDESTAGKVELDGTPEDRVGTEYTATTPVLSTEFITRIGNQPTVAENKEKSSEQALTSAFSSAPPPSTAITMNATIGASVNPPSVVTRETTSVSTTTGEAPALSTHRKGNLSTVEITTERATNATSLVTVFTTKAAPTTTPSTTSTTSKKVLTAIPQVTAEGTTGTTSAPVSNLNSTVATKILILPSTLTTKPESTNSTTQSKTSPATTFSVPTAQITTGTMSTTKGTMPAVTIVPGGVNTTDTTATPAHPPPQRIETTSSRSTIPTTTISTTSQVTSTQSTRRIWGTSSTTTTLPSTSTKLARPTSVMTTHKVPLKAVTTHIPTPRRITVRPVISTTFDTYIRSRKTTKKVNAVSLVYIAKSQTTTLDSLGDGTHALKSETVVPKSNSSSVIGASIGVIIIVCLIGGVTFVFLRRRRQKMDKLHDDSIRFLPDNEVIEYSDASVTDSLFQS